MLTKNDLDLIRHVVREEIDIQVDKKLKYLPTKEEFYTWMDKLMTELQNLRDDVSVVTGYKDQIEDHEGRLVLQSHNFQRKSPGLSAQACPRCD